MLRATHKGKLSILDGVQLECAVLENGTRVFSERAATKALGGKRGGSHWRRKKENGELNLPVYLSAKNLLGFIDPSLKDAIINPIIYESSGGKKVGYGIEATLLPRVCEVYLRARDAGALLPTQMHIVERADILIRSFAKVGIIALVDEATGYQEEREKDALNKLLSLYLSEERLKWAKRFPDSFYMEIYRLNKWHWPPLKTSQRPGIIGKYTNDIVYERLPHGVLDKLKELNPTDELTKRRKYKHHQFLSTEIGQPDLRSHLLQVMALMRASSTWQGFINLLDKALPKGDTYQLNLLDG
ncbi:P63C domain-containing protein [uncultured Desulfovibrio sp.]|uniref:P63C domain-containing protein n=1 Tax=uncultured Desulfovibrio sp. TaxID=167968 RepID=UPI0028064E6D|nr:P63C domain-containing protein [uncultured Desulfovibrio sp.]